MDAPPQSDDNINNGQNGIPQNGPIFETVPVEDEPVQNNQTFEQNLQPEEISSEVESAEDTQHTTPLVQPLEIPPDELPQGMENESKLKFIVIPIFAVLIFIVIFVVILSALNKKTPATQKKQVNLVYWGVWEDKEIMQPLIDEYERKNPGVKIAYEKKTQNDYRQKLLVRGEKGQGPDIFRFHNTWVPQMKDILTPLPTSLMSVSEYESTFYPITQKDLKIEENYYGIPLMIDGLVLLYNDDLFKKAGIQTAPTNWDELVDMAGKVQVVGADNELITAGLAMGTANNVEHFSDIFGLMLLLNGGSLNNLTKDEAVGALKVYRRFAESPNNTWSESFPNSVAAFIQGKVAMIIVPSWEIMTIQSTNPDLKFKSVAIPKPPNGKQISLATYWVEGVSRYSKNQEEAWKFLIFLSKKENMMKLYEIEAKTRLFGEPYSRKDLSPLLIQNPYIGAVIKQAENDSYVSLPLVSNTFDNGLNDEIIRYIENAINAASQGVSYSEALNEAQLGIQQIFSRYKIQ